MTIEVCVYMKHGYYTYSVKTPEQALSHAAAILDSGYRHATDGQVEWYPPHMIYKVKVKGEGLDTEYPDKFCRT